MGIAHVAAGSAQGLVFDQTAAGAAKVLRSIDLRTSRTLWSRTVPGGGWVHPIPGAALSDPLWVLMIEPDGAGELLADRRGA